ncbi:hypothetical protein [Ensifer sp. ENS08]|uniref:hypothetical protein n=1 Tax=Ensifer sp. ENS08 TaxID=2769273 RepID=UPI00178467CC|nr:hypothetical protein [Ensifer sp. ENS08]MBD9573428.1 hypothetical protein [Ensifer sp. ENS08]
MPLPQSLERGLSKIERDVTALGKMIQDARNDSQKADLEVEIGDLVVNVHLLLDKVMNAIYDKFGPNDGKKPHIYFPCFETEQKFDDKLKQTKLNGIPPELRDVLLSCQPFEIDTSGWWPTLYRLSQKRHEAYPQVEMKKRQSISHGGQDLYIKKMVIGSGGIEHFEGQAWNQTTGLPEPVRFTFTRETMKELAGTGKDPAEFLSLAAQETHRLVKKIGWSCPQKTGHAQA